MSRRSRSAWLVGPLALLLTLALSGAAAAGTFVTMAVGPVGEAETDPLVADTTRTYEDLDGDAIDDDCDDEVVADPDAVAAAAVAVDTDGDGVVSQDEAARSGRVGGPQCTHGGYVSGVAIATEDTSEVEQDAETPTDIECVPLAAPVFDPALFAGPGGFGTYVASVAASDVIGGKNCNHGGAVSEAVKAAKEIVRAERDAAKAERAALRDVARAERDAARAERAAAKAERAALRGAAKAERAAGKGTKPAAAAPKHPGG
ncbi:hypothetical protein BH20CHL7_BH20CHL7_00250 [soil metagenome]